MITQDVVATPRRGAAGVSWVVLHEGAGIPAGQVFSGEYRVEARLGSGGMGAVYLVEQLTTGRRRALKVMHPGLVRDERARERFLREAKVSAQIESAHVVEVIGAGVDEPTGTPWLAMELLEGEDLEAMVGRRGPIPRLEARELLDQTADALAAAHRIGVVHRDVKPENLFVEVSKRRGVPFTVKVLDYGIASVVAGGMTAALATSAIGSPLFMAPEQTEAQGKLRPATDVWAFGLVAFFVLTGRHYWRSANQPEMHISALLREVVVDELVPATVRARELGCEGLLPMGFDAWFASCVERDPARRFADAGAAITALRPLLEQPSATAPTAPLPQATMPLSSSPGVAPTAAMPAVGLGGSSPGWIAPSEPAHVGSVSAPARRSPVLLAAGGAALLAVGGALGLAIYVAIRGADDPPAVLEDVGSDPPDLGPVDDAPNPAPAPQLTPLEATPAEASPTPAPVSVEPVVEAPMPGAPMVERGFLFPDGSSRTWSGRWTKPGQEYQYALHLDRRGERVDGYFVWTPISNQLPVAREYVRGTWDPERHRLVIAGYRVSDPQALALDSYRINVGPGGALTGQSRTTSRDWSGRLTGRLQTE